jgi:GR25 family glycosyltransferase involved in LPS biosynthesis
MILTDGVNQCLRAIGEIKIPDGVDLDSLDPLHEAVQIRDIINEFSKEAQTTGWWFNKEDWTFIPDVTTGKISIPVNVLSIRGTTRNVILQGNNLYDVDEQTLIFEDDVVCETVFERDFEQAPESFAKWVVLKSAQEAQFTFKGDTFTDKKLEQRIREAYIVLEREQHRNKSYNLITSSRLVDRGSNPTPVA